MDIPRDQRKVLLSVSLPYVSYTNLTDCIDSRRHIDISAQERLEMLRNFTNFGLEHWGSDLKVFSCLQKHLYVDLTYHITD